MVANMVKDILKLQKILEEIEKIDLKFREDENDVDFNDFINEISYGILSLIISQ